MVQNHETLGEKTETQEGGAWDDLEKLGESGFAGKNEGSGEITAETSEAMDVSEDKQGEVARAVAKVKEVYRSQETVIDGEEEEAVPTELLAQSKKRSIAERYAASERPRVERIKSEMTWRSPYEYGRREKVTEPSTLRKVTRLLADKLGIKTRRGEEQREREATQVALAEYREEEEKRARMAEERRQQEVAERARREAEYKAERERIERENLERGMSEARGAFDFKRRDRYRRQRIQEIVERDLNSRLLTVDALETAALAEDPGIEKRMVDFEGGEIPVYDLKGMPFSMLSTTIDYRSKNTPGEIGTETYRTVMDDPAVWAERRDKAEQDEGFGTRYEDARGDTISTSYYNSERNLRSHVSGDLMYGFAEVNGDSIVIAYNGDVGSSNMAGRAEASLNDPDVISKLEGADGTNLYNEVVLRRYSENGMPKLPNYIIIEDGRMTEAALRHAKHFNIPIVNIERSIYMKKMEERGEALMDLFGEGDDYTEMDEKLTELRSMSRYKGMFHAQEGVGRKYDKIQLRKNASLEEKKIFELEEMELMKRLDFIAETLEAATQELEAQAGGESSGTKVMGQFDFFNVSIQDIENQVRSSEFGDMHDASYSAPGNCNSIDIRFRLKGSTRNVETMIYDGENIFQAEEALARGVRTVEDLEQADSSYYKKLEPLVRKYFEAYQKSYGRGAK